MNFVGQSADLPIGNAMLTTQTPVDITTIGNGVAGRQSAIPSWSADGVAASRWMPGPDQGSGWGGAGATGSNGTQGGFFALLSGLINELSSLIGSYTGQSGTGQSRTDGSQTQNIGDGTFASTGDPHLSETASLRDSATGNGSSVNNHFDSMTGHRNLLSSQDLSGGYRLSTDVTAPTDKGITMNADATVHLNNGSDTIMMRKDGSFSIASDGNDVTLARGQSVVLGGGENVTSNADGSLTIGAANSDGGSITTTLAAKAGGVDATATVHDLTVGGDIVNNTATQTLPTGGYAAPLPASPPQATPLPADPLPEQPDTRRSLLNTNAGYPLALDVSGFA